MDSENGKNPPDAAVDVHCHYVSRELLTADDRLQLRTQQGRTELFYLDRPLGPVTPELTSLEALREDMERARLSRRLLCTASWLTFYWLDAAAAQAIVRSTNDGLARAAFEDPAHLSALASLPLQDVDAAIAEADRVATELDVAGLAIGTNVAGVYLDDERFDPLFEAVQDLELPVFFHPDNVGGIASLDGYSLRWLVGNPQEVATCMARILLGGVLERYPRLKLCFSLGGGGISQLIGRLDHGWRMREESRARTTLPPSTLLRRCYVDSIVHSETSLKQVLRVLPAENVVLGSDWPWDMGTSDPRARIVGTTGLAPGDAAAILSGNARRLVRRVERPTAV
ncbi:MAG: amidohydrolase family protein [Acidimicrobiales bacterium]